MKSTYSAQSIVFQLTETAAGGNLWLGLSAPDMGANGGTVTITGNGKTQTINVANAVDQYYPIQKDLLGTERVLTVTNSGTTMISITNLKVTGVAEIYNAVKDRADAGTVFAVSDPETQLNEMIFEPITLRTIKLAANNGIDPDAIVEPGVPATPDEGKPTWDDNAFNPSNILKTLFQLLLRSLSGLFGGLGSW